MSNNNNTLLQYFDLEDSPEGFQDEFFEDVAETLLGSVMRKAWAELDGEKKEQLTELLEASDADAESKEKHEAVLAFLDENVINLREFVEKELEDLQTAYKTTRDELQDTLL